jgi:hypothetical protein
VLKRLGVKGGVKVDRWGGVKGNRQWIVEEGISGEKRLWSVAKEPLLPRSVLGGGGFSPLGVASASCGSA